MILMLSVESLLFPEISFDEINIHIYSIFCLDRSRHGGGILVYVKSSLPVTPIQSPNIPLSHHRSFSIATFYSPPSSPYDLDLLISSFSKLNVSILLNLILLVDFIVIFH